MDTSQGTIPAAPPPAGEVGDALLAWRTHAAGTMERVGTPGLMLLAIGGAALCWLLAASLRRAALERRDRALLAEWDARLATWAAHHRIPAEPALLAEARRTLDDEIARHLQQDRSLDASSRQRFAATLRSLMRQRMEAVLIREDG